MEAIIQFHKRGWMKQALPVMAVQSNTMSLGNVEASMSICQKSKLFSCGPHRGFWPFMAWSTLVVKFWSHSFDAMSTPMSFMEELELKSLYVGQLVCNNKSCDFFVKSSKRNETEWSGQTNTPFKLGHLPPHDSTLVCKVCKVAPICVNFCPNHIYYVLGKGDMSRACIHLGMHNHHVSDGIC